MNNRLTLLFSALMLLTVSCENNPDGSSPWDDPKFVRITAPTEVVRNGSSDTKLYYEEGQEIKVWDNTGYAVNLSINQDKDSIFFSYDWTPEAVPAFAVFPASEDAECSADGVFSVTLDAQQKVSVPGDIENFLSVGKILGANRTSYRANPMKNIVGYVRFEFLQPLVESVTLSAPGGEFLAGKVSVDYAKLENEEEDWLAVEEGSTSVTLCPEQDGSTLTPGVYYAAVLPGTYSQGLTITLNYSNGEPLEKTYGGENLYISRSSILIPDANALDAGNIAKLPDEIRIDLNFAQGWPFAEAIVSESKQTEAGYPEDTYSYIYKFDYEGKAEEYAVPFIVKGNEGTYAHQSGTFRLHKAWSNMAFPSFPEHYLRAVKVEVNNADPGKTFLVNDYNSGARLVDWSNPAIKGSPSVLSFPTEDGVVPEKGKSYKISNKEGNAFFTNISLLYSKTLPEEYDDKDPFIIESDLPEEITLTLDFASKWPFNESCAAKDNQVVTGESYTYTYTYKHEDEQKTQDMEFFITKGGMDTDYSYEYVDGTLFFDSDLSKQNSTAMIALPVIQGRYLTEVRAVHNGDPYVSGGKNYYPRFNLNEGFLNAAGTGLLTGGSNKTYDRADPGIETVMTLPNDKITESKSGQVYAVRMRDNDMRVTKFVITYSKTKPE